MYNYNKKPAEVTYFHKCMRRTRKAIIFIILHKYHVMLLLKVVIGVWLHSVCIDLSVQDNNKNCFKKDFFVKMLMLCVHASFYTNHLCTAQPPVSTLHFCISPLAGAWRCFRNNEKAVKSKDAVGGNFFRGVVVVGGGSSVQTCRTMKMYCIVKTNVATEGDNMLLNYSAIIYLQLIRLCCY